MASTILRVKRRLEENPQDALVLIGKRIKTDTEELSPSIFVFRGTVNNQETHTVTEHVKNILPKTDIKLASIPNVTDIIDKVRKEHKEATTQSRYEIVNFSRGLKEESNEMEDVFHLVDLAKKEDKDNDEQYAYDLYMSSKQDFDISMIDNLVGEDTDLILGSYNENGLETPSEDAEDDDDSNDENNWRNDYPESEPSSVDEEDMIRAMERVDIEDDLSSDAGEDKIYDEPPDLFNEDVKRYGAAYAKYKAKVLSEEPDLSDSRNLVHCTMVQDLDEESVDGYKDDQDDGFYYGQDEDTEQFQEQYRTDSPEYSPD